MLFALSKMHNNNNNNDSNVVSCSSNMIPSPTDSQTLRDRQYLFAIAVIRYNRKALCTKLNTWDTKILQIKFVKAVNSLKPNFDCNPQIPNCDITLLHKYQLILQ